MAILQSFGKTLESSNKDDKGIITRLIYNQGSNLQTISINISRRWGKLLKLDIVPSLYNIVNVSTLNQPADNMLTVAGDPLQFYSPNINQSVMFTMLFPWLEKEVRRYRFIYNIVDEKDEQFVFVFYFESETPNFVIFKANWNLRSVFELFYKYSNDIKINVIEDRYCFYRFNYNKVNQFYTLYQNFRRAIKSSRY